jgi:hypothetical protein
MENDFTMLKRHWLSQKSGEIWIVSTIEKSIWAQKFNFYFKFLKKTEIVVHGSSIIFLPWEKIFLHRIFEYYEDGFIDFFDQHHFKHIESNSTPWMFSRLGQFLFEKE